MSRTTSSTSAMGDAQAQQRLQEAMHHFQSGDTTRAEALAKALLRAMPLF